MKNIKNKKQDNVQEEKEISFIEKMRSDKKYSAKVQLIGYGIFVMVLVIYLNISSMGSGSATQGNNIINNNNDGDVSENIDQVSGKISLLESVNDNFSYDMVIEVKRNNVDTKLEEEMELKYSGRVFDNQLEINKIIGNVNEVYYKVDDNYYSKSDVGVEFVREEVIYDIIGSEYIELNNILELLDKASLDHVTDYSSGKKEYVYHLKVKDVIVSYQKDDVVEIEIGEENGVIKIDIDYTNLFRVIDDSILECELEGIITNIGEVEAFTVLPDKEESASEE